MTLQPNVSNGTELYVEEYSLDQKVQTVLGMIGSVGNFLLVHCFFRKNPKHPSDYFILAFSINDLGFCLAMSTLNSIRWVTNEPSLATTDDENHYRCTANLFVYSLKTMCSLLILAAMTINRWCAVCRPHYYKNIFSTRKVRLFLYGIVGLACARSLPYVMICWYHPISDHWGEQVAELVRKFVMYGVFLWCKSALVFCDALLMLVAYPLIGWRLRRLTNRRRQQTRGVRLASLMVATTDVDCTTVGAEKFDCRGVSKRSSDVTALYKCSSASGGGRVALTTSRSNPVATDIPPISAGPCKKMVLKQRESAVTIVDGGQKDKGKGPMLATGSAATHLGGMSSQSNQEYQRPSDGAVTATLFLVCAVYMLLMLPDSVLEFCHIYQIGFEFSENLLIWSTVLFNFYFVINPALYYFSNKYFQCYINHIFRKSAI